MSWTCPGHYKVHVHRRDSPGRPVHGHCPSHYQPCPMVVSKPDTDELEVSPGSAI